METFITLWPLWVYLIGISVAYAIIEDIEATATGSGAIVYSIEGLKYAYKYEQSMNTM